MYATNPTQTKNLRAVLVQPPDHYNIISRPRSDKIWQQLHKTPCKNKNKKHNTVLVQTTSGQALSITMLHRAESDKAATAFKMCTSKNNKKKKVAREACS